MQSRSQPSPSKGKITPRPAWSYWELQSNGRYQLAVSHGEPPREPKASEGDPTPILSVKPVPAHALGADGISPDFGEIEKGNPRPIREGERYAALKRAKEELRHVEEIVIQK